MFGMGEGSFKFLSIIFKQSETDLTRRRGGAEEGNLNTAGRGPSSLGGSIWMSKKKGVAKNHLMQKAL